MQSQSAMILTMDPIPPICRELQPLSRMAAVRLARRGWHVWKAIRPEPIVDEVGMT